MIGTLIWLLLWLLVIAAFLAVVRAVLSLPAFVGLQPYANLIYAVIVLFVVIAVVQALGGGTWFTRRL